MAYYLEYLRQFNFASMVVRLFLAMLVGGLIGFEREKKRRAAGFRTYMLVAIGAALTVILSQYLNFMLNHDLSAETRYICLYAYLVRYLHPVMV